MRRRRRKRTRHNPSDGRFDLGGLLFFGIVITGGIAIWGWKHMSDRDRATALSGF